MVHPAVKQNYSIVDLTSDDEDSEFKNDDFALFNAQFERFADDEEISVPDQSLANALSEIDHGEVIDLTAIPDIDVPPSDPIPLLTENFGSDVGPGDAELITEAVCLQLVVDIFPDVSVDHVLTLIKEMTTDQMRTKMHSEQIVNMLLEGTYPKEADVASKKRRRADSEEVSNYETGEHESEVLGYQTDAIELLKDEFLNVPVRHITNTFKQQKTLFKAYIALEEQVRRYQQVARVYAKTAKPRNKRGTELVLIERGSRLPKELRAAKKKIENEGAKRRKVEELEQAEAANLQQAKMDRQIGECKCCFTEHPLNRMISCSGKDAHLFCKDCPKQYIENEIGMSKCRPKCFADTDCKGTFSRRQLQQVLSDKTFERLEHMQQQQDLAAAGLDFLSECPFCDFKMECPPVDVDKEFRCQNTKCGKTSCRLCDEATHIPLSCEEAKKDGQLTLRHVVEEAMSAALIRKCNSCQRPFVKDFGCNKMSCSHCGNKQCYICSKNVNNYEHFGDVNRGRCALHDNVEDVHEQAVKMAADEAMAKVKAENPHLSDADLMIQVSDRVKQAELARRGQADQRLNEFAYHDVMDQLAHRPVVGVPPPPRAVQPPPRPLGGIGNVFEAAYNGLAAARGLFGGPPDPVQPLQPLRPRVQAQAHQYFGDAVNPLARVDPAIQAAQDRFQQQLRDADEARLANRLREEARQEQARRAQANRNHAEAVVRLRHAQEMRQLIDDGRAGLDMLRHQVMARPPRLPELPGFGLDGPPVNARNVRAGAGMGGGLAFGGLDANRAVRGRELDRWFEEQMRNMRRG